VSALTESEVDGLNVYEYTGGYAGGVIPDDLKRAILTMCKRIYDMDDLGDGVNNEFARLMQSLSRQPML
jgi:hypothetical protein